MKIEENNNPTYNLELSQEEFLVLFEALGNRTLGQWKKYRTQYGLTEKQMEHLILVSDNVYKDMDNYIEDKVNPYCSKYFTAENWLAQQYKEKYNEY